MNHPAKSSEEPAEGAADIPGRQQGSPTPAKDAPPPGEESAHELPAPGVPDSARRS